MDQSRTVRVRHVTNATTGECLGVSIYLQCPGCNDLHQIPFKCAEHGGPAGIYWDGDPYSNPLTFSPSLMVNQGKGHPGKPQCHSFVKNGRWQFLPDCTHALAGQFADFAELPEWLIEEDEDSE